MTLSAMLTILWIYATPCKVNAPDGISCRQYAIHLAAEKDLERKQ